MSRRQTVYHVIESYFETHTLFVLLPKDEDSSPQRKQFLNNSILHPFTLLFTLTVLIIPICMLAFV